MNLADSVVSVVHERAHVEMRHHQRPYLLIKLKSFGTNKDILTTLCLH